MVDASRLDSCLHFLLDSDDLDYLKRSQFELETGDALLDSCPAIVAAPPPAVANAALDSATVAPEPLGPFGHSTPGPVLAALQQAVIKQEQQQLQQLQNQQQLQQQQQDVCYSEDSGFSERRTSGTGEYFLAPGTPLPAPAGVPSAAGLQSNTVTTSLSVSCCGQQPAAMGGNNGGVQLQPSTSVGHASAGVHALSSGAPLMHAGPPPVTTATLPPSLPANTSGGANGRTKPAPRRSSSGTTGTTGSPVSNATTTVKSSHLPVMGGGVVKGGSHHNVTSGGNGGKGAANGKAAARRSPLEKRREKNRIAQQRFRERQKATVAQLEEALNEQGQELRSVLSENSAMRRQLKALQARLWQYERSVGPLDGPAGGNVASGMQQLCA